MTATFFVGDAIEVTVWWCEEHQTANRPNTLGCWIGYDLWEVKRRRSALPLSRKGSCRCGAVT